MQDTQPAPIQEGEIVSDTPAPQTAPTTSPTANEVPAFDINAFNATIEVVRRRIGILEKSKTELTTLKEMFNDMFVNDPTYNQADKIVKDAMKVRKDIQAKLSKQPQAVELNGKIKDLKAQIKENEESLSDELMEYYRTAGVTEIEDADGNVQEFTITVRLKSKKRAEK